MKSCGVIAEYNPFHNGHRFQLEAARKNSGAEVMVVAMSGNFTQRGEPAIFDKWQRARTALENGADLVLEQSILGSVQATDFFAKAGVRLLQQVGCNFISFGAENGSSDEFDALAKQLVEQQSQINEKFRDLRNDGRTYAAQMSDAIEAAVGKVNIHLSEPNNQLALAYLQENILYKQPMQPFVIQRMGAGHNDRDGDESKQASGTHIRSLLLKNDYGNLDLWVPDSHLLRKGKAISWEDFWPYLKYQLLIQDTNQLRNIYQMEEGIEFRLKKFISEAASFAEFMHMVKNKRWTWVRLQRLCLYILLGVTRAEVEHYFSEIPPVRILGFNEIGKRYLNQIKNQETFTFITNINKKTAEKLVVEIRSDAVYALKGDKEQNFRRSPIIIL
ncbi:nucleotidyltransferase [Jeotgalibaca sp. A127]|uniref:nucleotidyltransferase n=1 Tax=Jeotgalibaca sp. A127 TaxID=3457324 RepID=UPI003FD3F33F